MNSNRLLRSCPALLVVVAFVTCSFGASPATHLPNAASAKSVGGLVVALDCSDVNELKQLAAQPGTLVQSLLRNEIDISNMRARIHDAQLYKNVCVSRFDGKHLPYIDNVVSMIVAQQSTTIAEHELLRVLTPGGVARIRRQTGWKELNKPVPTTTDEWTHFMHGPDNNPVSSDVQVNSPNGLQWIDDPLWNRDHDSTPTVFGLVSNAGRLFYIQDNGPIGIIDKRLPSQHVLIARNAYSGFELWRRPIPDWYPSYVQWGTTPIYLHRRLVATGGRVYVTDGLHGSVLALNAEDGRLLHEFTGSANTSEILVADGVLLAATMHIEARPGDEYPSRRDQQFKPAGLRSYHRRGIQLIAFDIETGNRLWEKPCRYIPSMIGISDGKLFFSTDKELFCAQLDTGNILWQTNGGAAKLMVHDGVVITAARPKERNWSPRLTVQARDASSGNLLWDSAGATLPTFANCFYIPPEMFIANGLVWIESTRRKEIVGLELRTGKQERLVNTEGGFTPGHHVRCYPAKATENFALFNKRGIEFMEFGENGSFTKHDWIRGACRLGILPANGLVYSPPNGCNCCVETYVRGFLALRASTQDDVKPDAVQRLEHGTAYNATIHSGGSAKESDWPTFRHDASRRASTTSELRIPIQPGWEHSFDGPVAGATVTETLLILPEVDAGIVHALNPQNGEPKWRFLTGSRIDSPPTQADGRVVFGAHDGYVYCLNAVDGKLIWRFRAAPSDHQFVAFGQVESVWPCHGSVLVKENVVYGTAGRSSYLDGGIYLFGLDLVTGELRYQKHIQSNQPQETTLRDTFNNHGALTDILVSQGDHIFMRQLKFDDKLNQLSTAYPFDEQNRCSEPRVMATSGFLDDGGNKRVFRACSTSWTGRYSPLRTQQLAVDNQSTYGCRVHFATGWKSPRYHPGDGSVVFALDHSNAAKMPRDTTIEAAVKGNSYLWPFNIPREAFRWQQPLPISVTASVVADGTVLIAGRPDRSIDDTIAHLKQENAGVLMALSTEDGRILHQSRLPAAPIMDGIVVGNGNVFIVTERNEVICLRPIP